MITNKKTNKNTNMNLYIIAKRRNKYISEYNISICICYMYKKLDKRSIYKIINRVVKATKIIMMS